MDAYLALAELVLALHLVFIGWVMGGIFLVRSHPALQWPHIASLVYAIVIELLRSLPCPLTILEQSLERRAGLTPYHGPFLLHYLDAVVYPDVPLPLLIGATTAFCTLMLVFYAFHWRRQARVRRGDRIS
jgi:Protein of Unknown function (DUF2784)